MNRQIARPDEFPDDPNPGGTSRSSDPLKGVIASREDGSVLEMHTGLFNLGRNRARESGTTEPRDEDIAALTDHSRAMARQTYRDKYDPTQNAHDAMHEAEYRRLVRDRSEAEQAERHAAANLRDAELAFARAPKAGPKPGAHLALVVAFIVAITISVAPTTHDSIFVTFEDDLLAWFFSILTAAFIGAMLTLTILHARRTTWTWLGVGAGIVLGLGLFAVRLSGAKGAGEILLATGLTIFEIAAVLLLEWLAHGLRISEAEWLPLHMKESEAAHACEAAKTHLTRSQDRVWELDQSVARKIAEVENRHNRNIHLPELEAVAIKAVLDGYNAGITENIGRLHGVRSVLKEGQ